MSVVFRSAATPANTTATGNSTITTPAAAANGDVLYALAICDATVGTITAPSGWTTLYVGTAGTSFKFDFSYLILTGAPAANYTWGIAGTTVFREIHFHAGRSDVSATITLDSQSANGATGTGAQTTTDPPATVAVATTSLAVAGSAQWIGLSAAASGTPPTGYTLRTTNLKFDDVQMATKALIAAGSENPSTFGGYTSGNPWWNGFTVTFTDAGAAGTVNTECQAYLPQRRGSHMVNITY